MSNDGWGFQDPQQQVQRSRAARPLPGYVLGAIGVVLIIAGFWWKFTAKVSDHVATVKEVGQVNFGPVSTWGPILVIVVGFIVLWLGIRIFNRARKRAGLR